MPDRPHNILLVGGGTGGHIYPNLAIAERLREFAPAIKIRFLVSARAVDRRIMEKAGWPFDVSPALPMSGRPWTWPRFLKAYRRSIRISRQLIARHGVDALVTTGGFVSAGAMAAAQSMGVTGMMVNLDAVPGKANRAMVRRASVVFSVYDVPGWPHVHRIGMPLKRDKVGPDDVAEARRALDLEVDRPTLLVCGGSQGAGSINETMIALVEDGLFGPAIRSWQVLHLAGEEGAAPLREAYDAAGVTARVLEFCDQMGCAWRSADLAVSRAGAGSVAEAWANRIPTVFLPYPFHRDQHQRHNASPMVEVGGAETITDQVDPIANAQTLGPRLAGLMAEPVTRAAMSQALDATRPPDGADEIAMWLLGQ